MSGTVYCGEPRARVTSHACMRGPREAQAAANVHDFGEAVDSLAFAAAQVVTSAPSAARVCPLPVRAACLPAARTPRLLQLCMAQTRMIRTCGQTLVACLLAYECRRDCGRRRSMEIVLQLCRHAAHMGADADARPGKGEFSDWCFLFLVECSRHADCSGSACVEPGGLRPITGLSHAILHRPAPQRTGSILHTSQMLARRATTRAPMHDACDGRQVSQH